MRLMTVITLLVTALLLSGCQTQPEAPETRYYLLSSNDQSTPVMHAEDTRSIIGIAPITVAEYIAADGLALLNDNNQLHIARQHKWAEKPEHAIARTLQTDLHGLLDQVRIDNAQDGNSFNWSKRIRIHVDQLHGTTNGQAILTGFWRIDDVKTGTAIASKRFSFKQTLTEPGYGNLVIQLRSLVKQLAEQLSDQIPSQ